MLTQNDNSFTVTLKSGMNAEDTVAIRSAVLHLVSVMEGAIVANAHGVFGVRTARNRGKFGNLKKTSELEVN